MSAHYEQPLDPQRGVSLWVDLTTERGQVVDYTIVLLLAAPDGAETIRVYDSAHGFNEMHRYTQADGKQTGKPFHSGSLGEGVLVAIESAKRNYRQMIEGWRR